MNGDLPPYERDDDLLAEVRRSGRCALRVVPWRGVAVVIGRGGDPAVECRPEVIAADGAPLLRRPGGGCAVVLDEGNVIVSAVLPLPGVGGITSAFAALSRWLIAALAEVGVSGVAQRGVSDLAQGAMKIGGSCVYRTKGLLYYSTSLLADPDLDLVERYLPHPPREPDYRAGRDHRHFMGPLKGPAELRRADRLAAVLNTVLDPSLSVIFSELIENI